MSRRRFYLAAVLILFLAFALRLGGAIAWERFVGSSRETPFFFGDSDSYWQLGRALANGAHYEHDPVRQWKVFRMPGYPLLLSPLFFVSDDPPVFAARLENVFLGVATVLLTGVLANALSHDRRVVLLAMLLAAVLPELILQSVGVLSEELFCVITLALSLALIGLIRSAFSSGWAFLTGVLWGLAVYVRPDGLYLLPFTVLVYLLFSDARRFVASFFGRFLTSVGVTLLVFATLLAPWWVRNYRLAGTFVPTTLQVGASLYDGLSPTADGRSNMDFVDRFRNEAASEPSSEFYEVRLDRLMKNAALDWATTHPAKVFHLACVKFARLWNIFPNEPTFSALPGKLLIFLSFGPLLLCALGGVWQYRRNRLSYLLWIPAIYVTLLHLIFVSSLRYRAPVLPGLAILAALFLVSFRSKEKAVATHRDTETEEVS